MVTPTIDEAMEDIALTRAIEEGLNSKIVSRDEVFIILIRSPEGAA